MIGLPYIPAGQSLGLSGTPHLKAPQYVELTHTLVAVARDQQIVRRKMPDIVSNYTTVPRAQIEAWRTDPAMEHTKLQCVMEQIMEPQVTALKYIAPSGFTDAGSLYQKYPTLYQVLPDGTIRRGMDVKGEVAQAAGIEKNHDIHTPKDMIYSQREGRPFKVPNMVARKYLKPKPAPDMTADRPGPNGQGHYNRGQYSGFASNTITVNGLSPMVIAQARPGSRRELILNGPVGDFTSSTTASTLRAEKETVSVEPDTLDEVTELVSTMEKELQLRPITTVIELRKCMKPLRFRAHLDNPKFEYSNHRTSEFPFDLVMSNLFSPLYVRRNPRKTQYEAAVHFCNYATSYDQFKVFMLRLVSYFQTIKIFTHIC